VVQCVSCGAGGASFLFEKSGYRLNRCPSCDLVFVWPLPSPADLARLYDWAYFQKPAGEAGHGYVDYHRDHPLWGWVLDALPARPGRLLDLGCAAGYFLDEARSRSWSPCGVDWAVDALRAARSRGHPVLAADAARGLPFASGAFEAVSLWDVIEHVTDLHAFLAEAVRVLAPGGALLVNTPNVRALTARRDLSAWSLMKPPEHLSYFHRESLAALLSRHGLEIERTWCLNPKIPGVLGRIIGRIRGVRKLAYWMVSALDAGEALVLVARRKTTRG
jgi:SAM-dependent methyltransferase